MHGPLSARRLLLLLSRDQFLRDDALMARLTAAFGSDDLAIVRYESEVAVTTRLIYRPAFERLPLFLRQLAQATLLLAYPTRWLHFVPAFRRRQGEIAYRVRALRELVAWLGPDKEIIVLGRSAGARVASLVADELRFHRLICLAYPFEHPQEGPNPARYAHLAALQTPCLILQGVRDTYGSNPVATRYPLGPRTKLEWVDTDHHYLLSDDDWPPLLARIAEFIAPDSERAGTHPPP